MNQNNIKGTITIDEIFSVIKSIYELAKNGNPLALEFFENLYSKIQLIFRSKSYAWIDPKIKPIEKDNNK